MKHTRFYRWFRRLFYRMVEEEAWAQAQATGRLASVKSVEPVTDGLTLSVYDPQDTQPMQYAINASSRVSVPTRQLRPPASPTTNVLRKYQQKQPHVRPMKLYKSLWQLDLVPDRRKQDDRS